jgi:hypothetical protein
MKEDHILNGQLKLGYNWQISTENQYILGYTIHQTSNDTTTLQSHMESLKENLGKMPDTLVVSRIVINAKMSHLQPCQNNCHRHISRLLSRHKRPVKRVFHFQNIHPTLYIIHCFHILKLPTC